MKSRKPSYVLVLAWFSYALFIASYVVMFFVVGTGRSYRTLFLMLQAISMLLIFLPLVAIYRSRSIEPRMRRVDLKPADAKKWVDAPIAEIDKSTIGQLLASRLRREPGLHVIVHGPDSAPEAVRSDALYDPELDG